jgi:hypothetical protein
MRATLLRAALSSGALLTVSTRLPAQGTWRVSVPSTDGGGTSGSSAEAIGISVASALSAEPESVAAGEQRSLTTWSVPPGLSGLVVTFLARGATPDAKVEPTNREAVTFR